MEAWWQRGGSTGTLATALRWEAQRQRGGGSGGGSGSLEAPWWWWQWRQWQWRRQQQRRRAAHRQRNASGHGRSSCRHRSAATARCHSGNEDIGGDSNSRGTDNNQQVTKSSQWRRVHVGRVMPAGMAKAAATTAALPPRAAMVTLKTLAVTSITRAQATINNQLKAADSGGRTLAMRRWRAWPRQPPPPPCCHRAPLRW